MKPNLPSPLARWRAVRYQPDKDIMGKGNFMDRRLTLWIIGGDGAGHIGRPYPARTDCWRCRCTQNVDRIILKVLPNIFLNLIKMLIAPLVLSTIVVGIAHMGDTAAIGRIGFRAILWFITASFISIALGLILVNVFQPGVDVDISGAAEAAKSARRR